MQELLALKQTDYISGGYPETMAAAKPICDDLIDQLIRLGENAQFRTKLQVFKSCQERLNLLMNADHIRADTVERDIFFGVLERIGTLTKMEENAEQAIEFIAVLDSDDLPPE